jgi:hypothetical protein
METDAERDERINEAEFRAEHFMEIEAELMYRSYAANRAILPSRAPESFAPYYPGCDIEEMEKRFQRERR